MQNISLSYFCSSLNKITISSSITKIDSSADIKYVSLVEPLPIFIRKKNGNGSFDEFSALKSIFILSSVDSIAKGLFFSRTSLEKSDNTSFYN